MNRRELLKTVALLTGGAVVGGSFFMQGCKATGNTAIAFTPAQLTLLDEIGETIIPATDTPGAKAAQVSKYMQTMVRDCYTKAEQDAFVNGLTTIDEVSKKMKTKSFVECTPADKTAILVSLEKEAKPFNEKVNEEDKKNKEAAKAKGFVEELNFKNQPKHYYTMLKQLTLMGYFSSEVGMTKAMQYMPVPTKYDGAYPYKTGDKVFVQGN